MSAAVKQAPSSAAKKRKPHRWRPGTVAIREIQSQQKKTTRALPQLSVERVIREIAEEVSSDSVRFTKDALLALQEGAEQHLVEMFKEAQKLAIHSNRQTVSLADINLTDHAQSS